MMSLLGRMLLGMLLIYIPVQASSGWDWRTKINLSVKDQPLETVCTILEKEYGIHFSYSRNVVDLTPLVTVNIHNRPLKKALEEIFAPFNIHFARIGDQIVLTVKKHPTNTISGYVQDNSTGEKLIGATVYSPIQRLGTTTNQFGFFSLTIPRDTNSLQVTYIGYKPGRLTVRKDQEGPVIVTLQAQNSLPEFVVTTTDSARQQQEQIVLNRLKLSPADVKAMPRLLGEADLMRTIVAQPGVSGGIEGGGGLNVRGGSADQNLVLLDGTPIFSVSHLFGIFSVFNPDIVKNAEFYKGGFPARYGGRLSSIVDISLKDGDMQQYHGEAAIGLIAAKAMVEGPLKKDKTSFVVSARRSHADMMNDIFVDRRDEGPDNTTVYFYDANLKVNHIFSEKDRLYLSGYVGQDKLNMTWHEGTKDAGPESYYGDSRSSFVWGNYTGTLRWNHVFSPKLFANVTSNYSQYYFSTEYKYDYKPINTSDTSRLYGKYYSSIQDIVGKVDFEYRPKPSHTIRFGAGVITHVFNPGVSLFEDEGTGAPSVDTTYDNGASVGQEILLYAEDEWKASKSLWVNAGVHASAFLVEGRTYYSIQPRLGVRYGLPRRWAVKLSYTHMTQYLHLLTNSGSSLPTDLWVPSTGKVRPMFSRQGSVGISKMSKHHMYAMSVEGYYKTMDHVIEYSEYVSPFSGAGKHWDEQVAIGKGRSYGGEILLEKKKGTTRGWIGYTLSWSDRTFPTVNEGKSFPYKYDRRHDLEVVLTQRLGKRWELSATWEYTTGLPLTLPTASYEGVGDPSPYDPPPHDPILDHIGNRNEYRTSSMHRLDVSATYSKKKRLWTKSWTFSLYNAYNQRNPYYYYMVTNTEKQERYLSEISILPILPSVTYAIKF